MSPTTPAANALRETPQSAAPSLPPEPAASSHGVDIEQLWANVVEAVGRVSAFTRSYLIEAHPVSFIKNVFTIGFDPEFEDHLGLVDNAKNHALIQTKLAELGFPNSQVKFIKAEAPPGRVPASPAAQVISRDVRDVSEEKAPSQSSPPSRDISAEKKIEPQATAPAKPVAFSKDDFKKDPLIQKALEVFKGNIVEVRS